MKKEGMALGDVFFRGAEAVEDGGVGVVAMEAGEVCLGVGAARVEVVPDGVSGEAGEVGAGVGVDGGIRDANGSGGGGEEFVIVHGQRIRRGKG